MQIFRHFFFTFLILCCFSPPFGLATGKALTFLDIMQFRSIQEPVISRNGDWIAYIAKPDRGNPMLYVQSTRSETVWEREQGNKPVFSDDARWVAAVKVPDFLEVENKKKQDKPKQGLYLLDLSAGQWLEFEKIQSFAFSKDSVWLARLAFPEEEEKEDREDSEGSQDPETDQDGKGKKSRGLLTLRELSGGREIQIRSVGYYAFDPTSRYIVYTIVSNDGSENGVYARRLDTDVDKARVLVRLADGAFSQPVWSREVPRMAVVAAASESENEGTLWVWDAGKDNEPRPVTDIDPGYVVPLKNQLTWTRRGERLFFGSRPATTESSGEKVEKEKAEEVPQDPFDFGAILKKKEVDVWHWNDPRIIPHQKKIWKQTRDRTFRTVLHVDEMQAVRLADEDLPHIMMSESNRWIGAWSDVPYLKEITWEGRFRDVYIIDLRSGEREKFARRLSSQPDHSPDGRFAVFYQDRNWHLFDAESGQVRNLTAGLDFSFADEDHDYPSPAPGYGTGGWVEGNRAVLIYDKYDIWKFPTGTGKATRITGGLGRKRKVTFRVVRTDPDREYWAPTETILLTGYHDRTKKWGFYSTGCEGDGLRILVEGNFRYRFLGKARDADAIIYTRESYREFPDIWLSNLALEDRRKLTDVNPQKADFAWGEAELVEWNSLDGIPLQGVLIKPGNYEPGRRYPVLVYFYRFFSQRLNEFNPVVINHRPCFPFYAGNGYAIFLPDIRFEVGRPGFAATKCLVPGVQKLIDMGIADPHAIGLHGHSWSGYQTAFIITQTDIFAAAVAGAPVSNMTSAYSGIRWGSGLARQFQYEMSQSRIGGSLWEFPERYIENSPVFFADRIETPLLLMFGDEDGAVPWYQGIELYLAMRRLGKEAVFLQYRREPHHLRKYPNKLDYSIKMKEFLDHYLKGEPAPDWLVEGIPYQGK